MSEPQDVMKFREKFSFTNPVTREETKPITHDVYFKGQGKPVIILHELPGMTPECLRYANSVVDNGFTVYLPLFFGKQGETNTVKNSLQICISKEFKIWSKNESGRITDWLKLLSLHISKRHDNSKVGAIGMCLTGGFALVMMMDYQEGSDSPVNSPIAAPVLSQPSLPVVSFPLPIGKIPLPGDKKALGVPKDAFEATKQWATQQQTNNPDFKIPAFRFEEDKLCPKERFETLESELGNKINLRTISKQERKQAGIPKNKTHSVLTGYPDELGDSNISDIDPREQARKQVIEYLKQQLSS